MAARENFVSIEGNLVADLEVRETNSGMPVTTVTIANNERRLVDGVWTDGETSYFDVACFGQLAQHAAETFHKGDRISVTGRLRQRSWADRTTGEKRYKVEIVGDMLSAPVRFGGVEINRVSHTEPVMAVIEVEEPY